MLNNLKPFTDNFALAEIFRKIAKISIFIDYKGGEGRGKTADE
jgi:hypothetical protein